MPDLETTHSKGWPTLGKFWTIPNALSLFRLALALPAMYLILIDGPLLWIFILCVLAIASDYFDGRLARWSHTVSDWGKVLDPIADKVGGGLVLIALTIRGSLPGWFLLLVLGRDVLLLVGGIVVGRRLGEVVMSKWWGKATMTAVAITALAALLRADPPILQFCLWTTAAMLVYSLIRYYALYIPVMRKGTPAAEEEAEAPEEASL